MARKRIGQRKKGGHSAENMLRALILHRQGSSVRKAARQCDILYSTLNRYVKKYATISTEELRNQRLTPHYNVNMIFTVEQEAELTAYIKECAQTKALTTKEVRRAAYELAAVNDIQTPESWEREQMAGCDWLRSFKTRNFGPKKPEAPVSAIDDVVKELIDDNKVVSFAKALKTLEISVDRKKTPSDVIDVERESSNVSDEPKTNAIDLATDTDDDEMVILTDNEMVNENCDLSIEKALRLDGVAGLEEDKTNNVDVKIEMEHLQPSADEVCSQDPLNDKEDADEEGNTSVWSYYERESGSRARCVVCRAMVPKTDLKGHLKLNHPKLVAEVDLGSDEEASDLQEDVYTEIVYLEEEQNAKKTKASPKKHKPKPYVERSESRKRQASSSSDEAPLRQKKTKKDENAESNEEIEQFGKYVTCLLRKIPPAACMELQAEIINLIMKKQLELKRNETSFLAGDKMADTGRVEAFESTPSTSNLNIVGNGFNATEIKE